MTEQLASPQQESEVKETKVREELKFKTICESEWHEQVELKQFEKCPICDSESYHKAIVDNSGGN